MLKSTNFTGARPLCQPAFKHTPGNAYIKTSDSIIDDKIMICMSLKLRVPFVTLLHYLGLATIRKGEIRVMCIKKEAHLSG